MLEEFWRSFVQFCSILVDFSQFVSHCGQRFSKFDDWCAFFGSKCPTVQTLKTFSWRFSEVLLDFIAFAYGIRSLTMSWTNTWKWCYWALWWLNLPRMRNLKAFIKYARIFKKKHLTHLGCMCENSRKTGLLTSSEWCECFFCLEVRYSN